MIKNIFHKLLIILVSIISVAIFVSPTLAITQTSCTPLLADQLSSDISSNSTIVLIYTEQPYGQANNIFRYRPVRSFEWIELPISTDYNRSINNLSVGLPYEFQVNQECSEGEWTGWSESQFFIIDNFISCVILYYADMDQDGFGDPNNFIAAGCDPPMGYSRNSDDCDDTDASIPATPGTDCDGGVIDTDGCTCNPIGNSDGIDNTEETSGSESEDALIDGTKMTTSSISDHNTYIYTTQPHGLVHNQFRYRPIGASEWQMTEISTSYYRYLKDLLAGTEYEFQVRHERLDGAFYNFSASSNFTTTGTPESENQTMTCDAVAKNGLFVSSVSLSASYVYTPQFFGLTNNQFRYRSVGSSEWLLTDISTLYYRYLTDLVPGTRYEYQVRQECEAGNWSMYSDSFEFTTLNN